MQVGIKKILPQGNDSPPQHLCQSSVAEIQDVNAQLKRRDLFYHLCRTGPIGHLPPKQFAAHPLHRNVAEDSAANRNLPGGPTKDHLGIAGGTGIGYDAAAVHSYRLQAMQQGGNTMKEKKQKA